MTLDPKTNAILTRFKQDVQNALNRLGDEMHAEIKTSLTIKLETDDFDISVKMAMLSQVQRELDLWEEGRAA